MSLDGRHWRSPAARAAGSAAKRRARTCSTWRARSSSILTGIGTVLAMIRALTCACPATLPGARARQPLRVVLDRPCALRPARGCYSGAGKCCS